MNLKNFPALCAILVLSALVGGCSYFGANTNANNSNAAVATNTNTNTNTNKAPSKEDVDKNRASYEKQAKDAGRKVGKGASDLWMWAKVKYDLAAASDLEGSDINVDVVNSVITLTGTVPSRDQLKKADTIAKAVEGQKGVQNRLKVSAANKNASSKK